MNYRGMKVSELIKILDDLLYVHGDIDVCTVRGNRSFPVHTVEYYQKENHIEII